jgi:hypothetical protein
MGYSRKRVGRDGKPRYTAYYLDIRGQERSAGTFARKKDAEKAWQKAEGTVSAGKPGDPSRGRQTFEAYVLEKWLPHHLLESGVRKNYAGHIRNHLLPFFGPMKMRDVMPEHVREWVTYMKDKGASAYTIEFAKGSVLNAIFTTALMDDVVTIHPSHGVKTPATPSKPRRIITSRCCPARCPGQPGTSSPIVRTASVSVATQLTRATCTAARLACSCRTCTSGRARSGCGAWNCSTTTSQVSGRPTATTSTETHGAAGRRSRTPPRPGRR